MNQIMNRGYKPSKASANGTSFHNVIITAPLAQLLNMFGNPTYEDIDGKVTREWVLREIVSDGTHPAKLGDVVTIYDYKYDGAAEGYWHIGGKNEAVCLKFQRWFDDQ